MCKSLSINKPRVLFNFSTNGSCIVGLVLYRNLHSFLLGEHIKGFPLNKFCLKILRTAALSMPYYMALSLVICACGEPWKDYSFDLMSMKSLCHQKSKWLKWCQNVSLQLTLKPAAWKQGHFKINYQQK